jgi:DNA gyrase subunit B
MPNEELTELAREYAAVDEFIERIGRRYDHHVLRELARLAPVPESPEALAPWTQRLSAALNFDGLRGQFVAHAQSSSEGPLVQVSRILHGNEQIIDFKSDFFNSPDYAKIAALRNRIGAAAVTDELLIRRGERSQKVADFDEAFHWLLGEARRGLHVQRYKGLGEMNPDQLSETTLEPKNRRLVKVDVEDVVAADQIFTTLMGEHVEPRREFIEKNALLVGNLDL